MRAARPLLIAVLIGVCTGALALITGALGGLERETIALRFDLRGQQRPDDVAVVAIDDKTFSNLHLRWPFRRSLHAGLIDRLHADGVREIVYDVQFTEPTNPRDDMALFRALGRAGGAALATSETDRAGHTNVLGGDANLARIHARAGAANLNDDLGGMVTRLPYQVSGLRSLAVVAAERATGRAVSPAPFGSHGAWIDYRGGPATIPTYSFSEVYRGRVPAAALRGKVVVVGASAPVLQDVHATPTSGSELMPGPEIEANAIWTVLHGVPLRSIPPLVELLLIGLLGCIAPLARLRLPVLGAAGVAVGAAIAFAVLAQIAFDSGWIVAVVPAFVALLAGTVAMIAASHLAETRERQRVSIDNEILEQKVRERTEELRETQLEVVRRLAQAAESRDEQTGQHIERIGVLCERLGLAAGMSPDEAEMLRHASAMHDVGKIGIPDRVLLKPGPLDDSDWQTMKTHPIIGAEILAGSRWPLVQMGATIALSHHERWDGSGYPERLSGERIPLEARICAICDVFDALLSERPYKSPWTLTETMQEIRSQTGRHFDPRLVGIFLEMAPQLYDELGYASEATSDSRPEAKRQEAAPDAAATPAR